MITFNCPSCGHRVTADDKVIGRMAKCPKCQNAFRVPAASGAQRDEVSIEPPANAFTEEARPPLITVRPPPLHRTPRRDPLDTTSKLTAGIALAALAVLAVSVFLPWVQAPLIGGITGFRGDGKIVFVGSLVAAAILGGLILGRKAILLGALLTAAWGTFVSAWLAFLIYRIGTISGNADVDDIPRFVRLLVEAVQPGVGLIGGLLAALSVSVSGNWFSKHHGRLLGRKKDGILMTQVATQVAAVGLAIVVVFVDREPLRRMASGLEQKEQLDPQDEMTATAQLPGRTNANAEKRATPTAADVAKESAARQLYRRFNILAASLEPSTGFASLGPTIWLRVRNDTGKVVSTAYFYAEYRTKGRTLPWHADEFNYSIPGGLEPGETADWKLEPNLLSDWGRVDIRDDAVLEVAVIGLDGADDEPLAMRVKPIVKKQSPTVARGESNAPDGSTRAPGTQNRRPQASKPKPIAGQK